MEEMVFHHPARNESFLVKVDDVRKSINNHPIKNSSYDPVLSVGNHDGTRVFDRTQALLGEEVEKTAVEAGGGGVVPSSMS